MPDTAYLLEAASLLLRWLHLVVAIAWVGSSFYFIWLDNSLRPPTDGHLHEQGVAGELWAMHGGGFYNSQKYLVAPKRLPEPLHFFFWPSYTTWLSGFLLMSTLYYLQASTYMVSPAVAQLSAAQAVGIGLSALLAGWLVYDGLARLLIARSPLLFAFAYTLFIAASAYLLCQLLAGRAAYIHVGAMIATAMSGNVFFLIIPGQRRIVAAMQSGAAPDPRIGKLAKQRSVHNNYLVLPVLFAMLSHHFPRSYQHPHAWLVLVLIMLAAALIRHFFNLRHRGILRWQFPLAGAAMLLAVLWWIAPPPRAARTVAAPSAAALMPLIHTHCASCHAAQPRLLASPAAGVVLEEPAQLRAAAQRVYTQVVQLRAMPLGNSTQISEEERAQIAAWFEAGAR